MIREDIQSIEDAWAMAYPATAVTAQAATPVSGLANPQQWLFDALGGAAVSSGVRVTWWTALQSVPIAAAVRILAEDIAKLPVKLFKLRSDGGREELRQHPIWKLLGLKPNRWMTPFDFKAAMVVQLALNGNAIAIINRDEAGRPVELVPIETPRVALWTSSGEIWYYISFSDELQREAFGTGGALFPAADIIHVKWPISWQGMWGYSPIMLAREAIGNMLTIDRYAGDLYANFADIGGVLRHPGVLTEVTQAKLRKQWESRYAGAGNRGRTAILEEGMTFEKMSMTAEDAEFIANRKFSVEEAARLYRIPPYKLMDLTRTIQSNIEEQSTSYADDTLVPILVNFEDAYTDKLMVGREPTYLDIEHDLSEFLRGRATERYEVYAKAIANGLMTPNEARIKEGANPDPGGNVFYRNVNLVPRDMDLVTPEQRLNEDAAAVMNRIRARVDGRPKLSTMNGQGHA